jgi:quercetin dioxygenase-like cupin family protein
VTERRGDKWWPNEGTRLREALRSGARLSSGERAAAEREVAAEERRRRSPVVVRRQDAVFEPSSYKGVHIARIVDPSLGIEVRNVQLSVHRIAPGAHTEDHRHSERVIHVLNGTGHVIIDGQRHDWGPHDSIHIQNGAWHQFFNDSPDRPAHLIVGSPMPILEQFSPHAMVYKGDSFSDLPEDYEPEHPFTGERVFIPLVDGQKWMSNVQHQAHGRVAAGEAHRRQARVILKASEAVIERSEHKGDFKVGLVDEILGFDNRILAMYVHQLPPGGHTETHKHGEAIVYVLSGTGYSIVEGERHDWQAGDCIFVQPGTWHQHFNADPDKVSQHLAFYVAPLRDRIVRGAEAVEWVTEPGYDPPADPVPAGEAWWLDR